MHNIVHNMADENVGIPNHLTTRNGVCQYVRRVPEDLRAAFPFTRIQRSLGTKDEGKARAAAVELDRVWDKRFAEARRNKGLSAEQGRPESVETEGWTWPDWEALAAWFGASLAEEDWRARLATVKGGALGREPDLAHLPWRSAEAVKEHIERGHRLREITVAGYAEMRLPFVQSHVRRVGVSLSRTSPELERFMAACLKAELDYFDLFQLRESRRGGLDHRHPDSIEGPWRRAPAREAAVAVAAVPQPDIQVGKTLKDCRAKWIENRGKAKKQVRPEYLREMDQTVAAFEQHARVADIGQIRRKHVLAFRDHLGTGKEYKVQTINKKVGFLSSLMSTALNAGWIETGLGPELFLEVPEDEDQREPYSDAEIGTIFAHPVFTAGHRLSRAKASGEVQFWLPLIACLHGMISSEILQLGPDTVCPHPDAPEILCFNVTNAGDRRLKTYARRRWVPVRRELIEFGLVELVEAAQQTGRRWLWSAMEAQDGNVTRVSGYFSSFWADFTSRDLKIGADGKSLYSFRHAFQDRLAKAGFGEEIKKALMGHAETGMTGRYGTKMQPRVVNIQGLNHAVQGLNWPFLSGVRAGRQA